MCVHSAGPSSRPRPGLAARQSRGPEKQRATGLMSVILLPQQIVCHPVPRHCVARWVAQRARAAAEAATSSVQVDAARLDGRGMALARWRAIGVSNAPQCSHSCGVCGERSTFCMCLHAQDGKNVRLFVSCGWLRCVWSACGVVCLRGPNCCHTIGHLSTKKRYVINESSAGALPRPRSSEVCA